MDAPIRLGCMSIFIASMLAACLLSFSPARGQGSSTCRGVSSPDQFQACAMPIMQQLCAEISPSSGNLKKMNECMRASALRVFKESGFNLPADGSTLAIVCIHQNSSKNFGCYWNNETGGYDVYCKRLDLSRIEICQLRRDQSYACNVRDCPIKSCTRLCSSQ